MGDSVPRPCQAQLEELSPFELKDELIALADDHRKRSDSIMLNAGRGNPNWVAGDPREAFFLLGKFAIGECRRTCDEWDELAGMPVADGIADRLTAFLTDNSGEGGADLLARSLRYEVDELGFDADAFVHELTDSVVGDNCPVPDRMLLHARHWRRLPA